MHKKHHGMKKCLFYPCLTHQTSLYVEYRRVESVFLKCVLYQVPRIMVPLSTPELLHPMPLAVMPTTAMSSVLNTMPYTQMELRPSPALISCLSHGKGYSGAKVAETTEHTVAAEEPDNITMKTTTEQRSQETENIDNILDDSSTIQKLHKKNQNLNGFSSPSSAKESSDDNDFKYTKFHKAAASQVHDNNSEDLRAEKAVISRHHSKYDYGKGMETNSVTLICNSRREKNTKKEKSNESTEETNSSEDILQTSSSLNSSSRYEKNISSLSTNTPSSSS